MTNISFELKGVVQVSAKTVFWSRMLFLFDLKAYLLFANAFQVVLTLELYRAFTFEVVLADSGIDQKQQAIKQKKNAWMVTFKAINVLQKLKLFGESVL